MSGSDEEKRRAGESAAAVVDDGTTVGLGSGSTAAYAIRALGERVDAGLDVRGVPTSYQSRQVAREAGVPLTGLDDVDALDVAIDGADQVADGTLVKGGGASHAREKVVAGVAERFVVVVTDNGNLVLDCDFGRIDDPAGLGRTLSATPGVVEHGLFVELADEIHVGTADGVRVQRL